MTTCINTILSDFLAPCLPEYKINDELSDIKSIKGRLYNLGSFLLTPVKLPLEFIKRIALAAGMALFSIASFAKSLIELKRDEDLKKITVAVFIVLSGVFLAPISVVADCIRSFIGIIHPGLVYSKSIPKMDDVLDQEPQSYDAV